MNDKILKMFNKEGHNTWAFVGGIDTAGCSPKLFGIRNFAAHFEEYIRWTIVWPEQNDNMRQRYVCNMAWEGCSIRGIIQSFSERLVPYGPAAIVILLGREDLANNYSRHEIHGLLKELAEKVFHLNSETFLVLQTPFPQKDTEKDNCAKAYTKFMEEFYDLYACQYDGRLYLCNYYRQNTQKEFAERYLFDNGQLNAEGHLLLAKQLLLSLLTNVSGNPFDKSVFSEQMEYLTPKMMVPHLNSSVLTRLKQKVSEKKDLWWLFMGDSITHGCQHTGIYCSFVQYWEYFLKHSCKRLGDIVLNTAVAGATTETTIKNMEARLSNIPADIVFLMLGTNDSHENKTSQEGGTGKGHTIQVFQENLREILRKII